MRHSTVIKSVLASIVVLGAGIPAGHAQNLFFGMMSEQTPVMYSARASQLTEDEAKENFKAMDMNSDGVITRDEFSAAYSGFYPDESESGLQVMHFGALDGNKDGKITREEFIANRNVAGDEHYTMKTIQNEGRIDNDE